MPETPDIQFLDKYRAETSTSDNAESSNSASARKRRVVSTEDKAQDESYVYDVPEDQFEDEDEEGRFFGGGLTEEQSKLLDLVDQYDAEEAGIKKLELPSSCTATDSFCIAHIDRSVDAKQRQENDSEV